MEFNRWDSVKTKKGVIHPMNNLPLENWQGRVLEVYDDGIDVELDSISLKNLSAELLGWYEAEEEYPHVIFFPKEELEPAEARDTFEEVEKAQDDLIDKIDGANSEEELPIDRRLFQKWVRHFQRSDFFFDMKKINKENCGFVLGTFFDYMYDYEGSSLLEWDDYSIREVCLYWAPRKISAEIDVFESYGEVLYRFFQFLEKRKYLKTASFQKLILDIKDEIVEASQNSANWGMAKSFFMGAIDDGVNMNDKKELDDYLSFQQLLAAASQGEDEPFPIQPPIKSQKIGRNERVTVKYTDGRIRENIKYKLVEADIKEGKCSLQ